MALVVVDQRAEDLVDEAAQLQRIGHVEEQAIDA